MKYIKSKKIFEISSYDGISNGSYIIIEDNNHNTLVEFDGRDNGGVFVGSVYVMSDLEIEGIVEIIDLDIVETYDLSNEYKPKELFDMLSEILNVYTDKYITIGGWDSFLAKFGFKYEYEDLTRFDELEETFNNWKLDQRINEYNV